MKDKVLQLIEDHIAGAERDVRCALLQSEGWTISPGQKIGQSTKFNVEILVGYEQSLQEAHDMKAWFLGEGG